MKALRLKSIVAAFCLCLVAAGAGAQHMGGGRGQMSGGHMGGGRPGGAPVGSHPGFTHPGFTHIHGVVPHHGGFPHGHFVHGFHGGVVGIWWVSGGIWYPWYDGASYAYAYPSYAAPDSNVWYYCQSVGGYYPYVSFCPEGWVPVAPYSY